MSELSSPPTPPIRVLCVEDHRIVREGIELIVNGSPDLRVVASASSGEQALVKFRQCQPDVILMDLQLPGISGVEAIRRIRREAAHVPIVVLTVYQGDHSIYSALDAGATTYLSKDALSDELLQVIRDAYAGRCSPSREHLQAVQSATAAVLTSRETDVLRLIAEGMSNKEIAACLMISRDTVQVHTRSLFVKLGVHDRTSAVRVGAARGIVRLVQG